MDFVPTLPRRFRFDIRQRRSERTNSPDSRPRKGVSKQQGQSQGAPDRLPLLRKEEERNQITMTKDHRFYHRRQAGSATKILTVNVEVVATVDTSGNLVGQETKTQADATAPTQAAVNAVDSVVAPAGSVVDSAVNAVTDPVAQVPPAVPVVAVPSLPQVPAVPAMPTVAVPTVPAVPPFPTDLTVPAYPFPSAAALQVSTGPGSPSPSPTSAVGSSAVAASSLAALNSVSNSTVASTSSFASSASLSARSASASISASDSASVAMSSRSGSLSSTATGSSQHQSATTSSSSSSPAGVTGFPSGGPANTADPALNTAAAGSGSSGPTTPLQTPQVVGSVVGSLAGAALILAIILMLLRRHKRQRRGALQLTGDETTDRAPPAMSQDPARNNRIPSAFLNRFSGMSKSTIETNTSAGERGFQRVSGRKLPSAFSEGMTSDQFSRGGTLSGSSFYTDDQGTYGGPGISKEFGKEYGKEVGGAAAAGGGAMSFRPGPARTPVIRHPEDGYSNPFADPAPFPRDTSHLSPPQSPNPDIPRNTLGRSLHSHDGSRSSKFTENV